MNLSRCFLDDPLKMTPQDRAGPGRAHDVLRVSNDLHHLVAISCQIPEAAEVHVSEPQHVTEFVR